MIRIIIACLAILPLAACAETIKERQSHASVMPNGNCYKTAMIELNKEMTVQAALRAR